MSELKVGIAVSMEPVDRLPVTEENLRLVTSVALIKKVDHTGILVEHAPGDDQEYAVLDLFDDGPGGIKEVGRGGIKTIVTILEALTGQQFELVKDDEHTLHYRRSDLNQKIIAAEE